MRLNEFVGLSQKAKEAVPPVNIPETNVAMMEDRVRLVSDRELMTIGGR
jgi:hypothetical protein